jgi:hypothetical protein
LGLKGKAKRNLFSASQIQIMKPGNIVLAALPQSDGKLKQRPALLLVQLAIFQINASSTLSKA